MVSLINPIAGKDQATGAQTAVLVVKKMACSPSSLSTYPLRRARGRRYCAYFKKGSFPPARSSLLSLLIGRYSSDHIPSGVCLGLGMLGSNL